MLIDKLSKIKFLQRHLSDWRKQQQTIALVSTMGNLHKGHLQLIKEAQKMANRVVVSIFVNPTQFVAGEDFEIYPRTMEQDIALLQTVCAGLLFHPDEDEIYPDGLAGTQVTVPGLEGIFCGASRPGHFNGISTIITKLFNIVSPDIALFGEKDYQQLLIIKKLARDLCLPVEIVGVETVRDKNGLALSSRNSYLSKAQQKIASKFYKTLLGVSEAVMDGVDDYQRLEQDAHKYLQNQGFRIEYLNIRNAADLGQPDQEGLIVLAAVWLDKIRLIDNVRFSH